MTGNDLKQIGHIVTIEGVDYNLVIDMNALIDLDEKYKAIAEDGETGIDRAYLLLLKGDLRAIRYFFYLALRHSNESITEKEAGKIIGSTNLHAVVAALRKAMTVSLPESDEKNAVAPTEEM